MIAFEPNEVAAIILRCNVALNGLSDRIEVQGCALGSREGRGRMAAPRFAANIGATPITEDGDDFAIVAGDRFLSARDVGFIKIDVEGFELEVLEGLRDTISRCQPNMLVEVDHSNREEFDHFINGTGYFIAQEIPESETNSNLFLMPIGFR